MGSSTGVLSNCADFVEVLSRLEIVMVKIENWMILQRSVFDITIDGEPYPAIQLYFNLKTGAYLTRVWGKTHSKGDILADDVTAFEMLCIEIFGQGLACCPGQTEEDGSEEHHISVEYPFQRKVAAGCTIVHISDVKASVALCVECKSNENSKIEITDEDILTSLSPDVKVSKLPGEQLIEDMLKKHSGKKFKDNAYLSKHLNTHKYTKPHLCQHCDANFATWSGMDKHIRYKHTKEKPFKCVECEMRFVEKSKVRRHMLRVHDSDIKYKDIERDEDPDFDLASFDSPVKKLTLKSVEDNDLAISPPRQNSLKKEDPMANEIIKAEKEHPTHVEKAETEKTTKSYFMRKRDAVYDKKDPGGDISFACQHCSYKGTTSVQLNQHQRNNHSEEYEKERKLTSKRRVPKTFREIRGSRRCPALWRRTGKDKFECEHCGLKLTRGNWKRIARHYRRQHQWGNFFCKLCKFFAYYPNEYASHMLDRHLDMEGGVTSQCAECGEEVHLNGNGNTLAEHYKECAVAVENLIGKLHRERKKKDLKDQDTMISDVYSLCQICGKDIKQKNMPQHMHKHKMAESPECDHSDCNALFATPEAKKKHLRTAHKRSGVPCEKCGKFFQHQAQLREHIMIAHEKKSLDVKCTECDMVFTNTANRNRHRIIVHYPNKFRCIQCQRSFSTVTQLQRHSLVHSGEQNFSCDECEQKFKSKQDLIHHKRVHRGEKPFSCQYCSYKGTTNSLLYHHKRSRHRAEFDLERREKERAKVTISEDILVEKTV